MCVPPYPLAKAFYWTMQNLRKMFEYPYIYGGVGVASCLPGGDLWLVVRSHQANA